MENELEPELQVSAEPEGLRASDKEVIVVSGSSGLIGSAIINRLAKNYRMIGLDRPGNEEPPVTCELVSMDITSEDSINEAMKRIRLGYGDRIASVIHLAAYYDFSGKPSPLYDEITVEGTRKLLRALQKFEVGQFIFSSSLLVYKPTKPGVKINEESPVEPAWDYPESKISSEAIIKSERRKIPAVTLRIAGVYTDEGDSIPVTNHIQRIYEKQLTSHFFPGNMTHGNPYVHLADLADAFAKTVEKRVELPGYAIINIGESETLGYGYLQENIGKQLHGKPWKTSRIPKSLAKAGALVQNIFGNAFIKPWMIRHADDHMELDISKAKRLINWVPKHSLRETLPKMIAALKADPEKWYKHNNLK
jgi:nucleoside-diphosphate-sugar epimerase